MKLAAGASLNWILISAFRSLSALPALKMNGTPAQRGVFTKHRRIAKVGVLVSLFFIVGSSV